MKELLTDYGPFVILAINAIGLWVFWSARKAFATKEELKATQDAVATIDSRVSLAERELKALPSKDDFHKLQLKLTETLGEMKAMAAVLQSERSNLGEQMRRHEDALVRHESIFADAARRTGA